MTSNVSGRFKFAYFNYPAMHYVTKCQFLNVFCFDKALKNKNDVCNLKLFAQSYLLFHLFICFCLWTIGLLWNVYDMYKSVD